MKALLYASIAITILGGRYCHACASSFNETWINCGCAVVQISIPQEGQNGVSTQYETVACCPGTSVASYDPGSGTCGWTKLYRLEKREQLAQTLVKAGNSSLRSARADTTKSNGESEK